MHLLDRTSRNYTASRALQMTSTLKIVDVNTLSLKGSAAFKIKEKDHQTL